MRKKVPNLPIYTYKLTVSPKGDISQDCIKALCRGIEECCKYYYVVTEHGKSGQLHLHAALVLERPQPKKHLRNNIAQRYVKPYHCPTTDGTILSVAVNMHVMYDHGWYEEYLRKEEDVEVCLEHYVKDEVTTYFPTVEQQQQLQELQDANLTMPLVHQFVCDISRHLDGQVVTMRYIVEQLHYLEQDGRFVPRDERAFKELCKSIWRHFTPTDTIINPSMEKFIKDHPGERLIDKSQYDHLQQVFKEDPPDDQDGTDQSKAQV